MSFTMNSKIVSARKGDESARQEIQSRLKVELLQCLDSQLGGKTQPQDESSQHSAPSRKKTVADGVSATGADDCNGAHNPNRSLSDSSSALRKSRRLPVSALVNRLGRQFLDRKSSWQDKIYFYRLVVELMPQALRDFVGFVPGNKGANPADKDSGFYDFSLWDKSVQTLVKKDSRLALMLELYYMGGMSYEGIASALCMSIADVDRKLRFARAWVCRGVIAESC